MNISQYNKNNFSFYIQSTINIQLIYGMICINGNGMTRLNGYCAIILIRGC